MALGGKREGAGRKTKLEELGLSNLLDECWTREQRREVIEKLHSLVMDGGKVAVSAAKLLLAYAYGNPTEYIKAGVNPNESAKDALSDIMRETGLPEAQARAIVASRFGVSEAELVLPAGTDNNLDRPAS